MPHIGKAAASGVGEARKIAVSVRALDRGSDRRRSRWASPGSNMSQGAAWAWAVRPPRQSATNTNARPNLPEKMDIRATASCSEIIQC